jgi:6,7-dimethyl-8-ribityllumazine synthase
MTISESGQVLQKTPEGISKEELKAAIEDIRHIVILKTLWYPKIIEGLEESARAYLKYFGIAEGDVATIDVPGSYELPLAVKQLVGRGRKAPDFIVALGCVIRGGTPHFDYVCQAVANGLMQVQLETQIPLGFGVLTVDNQVQAEERMSKGSEAAQAALFMYLRSWREKQLKQEWAAGSDFANDVTTEAD